MENKSEQCDLSQEQNKNEKMEYPDFENLENFKKVGTNVYDVFQGRLSEALKEFEMAGLKVTNMVEHKVEEPNHTVIYYYITVDWIEKK